MQKSIVSILKMLLIVALVNTGLIFLCAAVSNLILSDDGTIVLMVMMIYSVCAFLLGKMSSNIIKRKRLLVGLCAGITYFAVIFIAGLCAGNGMEFGNVIRSMIICLASACIGAIF